MANQAVSGGVTAATGFRAAGVRVGLKQDPQAPDLGLLVSDLDASAAAVFTTHQFPAAPVLWDREHVRWDALRVIAANSGNANACTGAAGLDNARQMAEAAAHAVQADADQAFVASTGKIGQRLPIDPIARGIAEAAWQLSPDGGADFARAIMTTDTRPKEAAVRWALSGAEVTLGGAAKGAGMIAPHLATMLVFLTTDAAIEPGPLAQALRRAIDLSFNRLSIDGCMSTNDTVVIIANGKAGNRPLTEAAELESFTAALTEVCESLAVQIADDGEGAAHRIEVEVAGARSEMEAETLARAVAESALVKTAVHGADPNWGRIVAAAGQCGIPLDPQAVTVYIQDVEVFAHGEPRAFDEAALSEKMQSPAVKIRLGLGSGDGAARVLSCDLTAEYVRFNADYHT